MHGEDQTWNIWMSRSIGCPDWSFDWRGLHFLNWNPVCNFGDSCENVFDMNGDSHENLLHMLSVVIIWSTISFVCWHTDRHVCLIYILIYMIYIEIGRQQSTRSIPIHTDPHMCLMYIYIYISYYYYFPYWNWHTAVHTFHSNTHHSSRMCDIHIYKSFHIYIYIYFPILKLADSTPHASFQHTPLLTCVWYTYIYIYMYICTYIYICIYIYIYTHIFMFIFA